MFVPGGSHHPTSGDMLLGETEVDDQNAGAARPRPTSRLVVDVVRALRGWVVAAAGGVLLLGCYLGVSKETDPGLQLPYIVSGGFGGLALVLVGSALLVADRLDASQAGQGRVASQVDDLHALIIAAAGTDLTTQPPAVPAATQPTISGPVTEEPAVAAAAAVPADDRSLYAVPTGRTFHRASCELLAGKPAQAVDDGQIGSRGLSPCSVCAPGLVA
jgi:hypothetical protein